MSSTPDAPLDTAPVAAPAAAPTAIPINGGAPTPPALIKVATDIPVGPRLTSALPAMGAMFGVLAARLGIPGAQALRFLVNEGPTLVIAAPEGTDTGALLGLSKGIRKMLSDVNAIDGDAPAAPAQAPTPAAPSPAQFFAPPQGPAPWPGQPTMPQPPMAQPTMTPPQGYAQPPQGYAQPPQGMMPPQGYAQPPQGYAQPAQGMVQPGMMQPGYAQQPNYGPPGMAGMPQGYPMPRGVQQVYAPPVPQGVPADALGEILGALSAEQWATVGTCYALRLLNAINAQGARGMQVSITLLDDGRVGVVLGQRGADGRINGSAAIAAEREEGDLGGAMREAVGKFIQARATAGF